MVSCAILTPAEVLKQNAQVLNRRKGEQSPTIKVFNQFRNNPSRLWRGYTALAARNLPFTALQFPVFEQLKEYFMKKRVIQKDDNSVNGILERGMITATSAAIAGSGSAWITTPIDVVKTRIMLAAADEPRAVESKAKGASWLSHGVQGSRKSGWTVARDILTQEGTRGLFRGAILRSAWTAMGSGLYLGCYETGRHYLEMSRKASEAQEGDHVMQRNWKDVKTGIGRSRSQDVVKKSAWQDD